LGAAEEAAVVVMGARQQQQQQQQLEREQQQLEREQQLQESPAMAARQSQAHPPLFPTQLSLQAKEASHCMKTAVQETAVQSAAPICSRGHQGQGQGDAPALIRTARRFAAAASDVTLGVNAGRAVGVAAAQPRSFQCRWRES
jgi:hypothetical protein